MSEQKNKKYALAGTIIFAVIVLLILLFGVMRSVIPPKRENVVELDFFAQEGLFEPARLALGIEGVQTDAPAPEVPSDVPSLQPPPQAPINDNVITQNRDEAIAIARQQERRRQEEERRQQQEAIRRANALAQNAFTAQGGTGSGQGDAAVQGGSPSGSPDGGSATGVSVSSNLQGRFGGSPLPRYTVNERGIVVVEITVDANGRVTRATPGAQGTTTTNQELRNAARDAALKASFSLQEGARSQQGTITYIFNLN